ncbi:type VI secretion system tip protein VgrG [Rugamonas sp. FT107W]|uniref:Type VI secretion system tip protein VgrG n=1 Tax=Duganella vulcania TaxID=2692166 RepID=A0A845HR37_9BURK|nr:type VI secretion system tip protein VgrG [Duganella vulcania]
MGVARELSASNRPLRLQLSLPSGLNDELLLPQRVFGSETVCGGIEYRVLCVSSDACLPLKKLIAVPATLHIVTDIGELRSVCGLVTEASSGDSDGGLASYQVLIRDALAILEKRTNTRVFRNMDEVEIVQRILNEWRHKDPTLGVCFKHEVDEVFHMRQYPKREFTMQHNESDAAFIRRLLKRRGIGWYVRSEGGDYPLHTLVLFNRAESMRRNAAGTIRYHRDAATEERDTITSWSAVRSLQPGRVTRHSWDYRNLGRDFMMASVRGDANQGPHGNGMAASLDDYQVLAPHAGDDNEDLCILGKVRMNRHDYESKCFHGEGSVRDLCAGEYFTLTGHPEVDRHPAEERDFIVTALQVNAQSNLPKALAARVERLFTRSRWMQGAQELQMQKEVADQVASGPLRMHIQFTAVRFGVVIVPAYDPRTDVPQALMQSAIVVGPKGEEVHCDQIGRVKIRFPATREVDHEEACGIGASDSDRDSAWVRVASNWAGNGPSSLNQCGTVALPRVGTEVLVNFLGGDPDKPVIVGQLYNQQAHPPALSNMGQLPGNRYLSGIKSREIRGGRANQLRFDDTDGQISAQLTSDHGATQLNLGFLTQPNVDGYGDPRGEGAELRSEKAISIRGAQGILVNASERGDPGGRLLSRAELVSSAALAKQVAGELATLAEKHAEDPAASSELAKLVERINKWDGGHCSGSNGSVSQSGEPIVAVCASAGTFVGSESALTLSARSSLDMTSAEDVQIAGGANLFLRAARGVSMFAFKLGIKLIAASGNIRIQSQDGDVEITSLKRIKLIANEGIEFQSPTVKLVAQGCQVNYGGGAITQQSSGVHTIKSSKFSHESGGDGSPENLHHPKTDVAHDQHVLVTDLITDQPLAGRRYRVTLEDGQVFEGTTNKEGLTEKFSSKTAFAKYQIELLD